MRKIFTIFVIVVTVLVLNACTTSNIAHIPTATIINHNITDDTVKMVVNVVNKLESDEVYAILLNEDNEIEKKTLTEGVNEIDFSNMDRETSYIVKIVSNADEDTNDMTNLSFKTGTWEYNAPSATISNLNVNLDTVSFDVDYNDSEQVTNSKKVVLISNLTVIDQQDIDNSKTTVEFNGLRKLTNYKIKVISSYNLGNGILNDVEMTSEKFSTEDSLTSPIVESFVVSESSANALQTVNTTITLTNVDNVEIDSVTINGKTIKSDSFEEGSNSSTIRVTSPAQYEMNLVKIKFFNGFDYDYLIFSDQIENVTINLQEDNDGYKLIHNITELKAINQDLNANYRLANDIKLEYGAEFVPLGSSNNPFNGTFDGNNYSIENMKYKFYSQYVGLFSKISSSATVKNIHVEITKYTQYLEGLSFYVGGVVGYNDGGTISNVSVSGSIAATNTQKVKSVTTRLGGVVGHNNGGTISDVSSSLDIIVYIGATQYIGGVVGSSENSVITDVSYNGEISTVWGSPSKIGGIAGGIENSVITGSNVGLKRLYNESSGSLGGVVGECDEDSSVINSTVVFDEVIIPNVYFLNIGGVVGENLGSITKADVNIKDFKVEQGIRFNFGGIVGYSRSEDENKIASITEAYTNIKGNVAGGNVYIGGIAGKNNDTVIQKSTGIVEANIKSVQAYLGGIAGENKGEHAVIKETVGTSLGNITGYDGSLVGGIVGLNGEEATVENSIGKIDTEAVIYTSRIDHVLQYAAVGSVVGENLGIIENVYGSGNAIVNSEKGLYVGGLVGYNAKTNDDFSSNEGGIIRNSVCGGINVTIKESGTTSTHYGIVVGNNEVEESVSIENVYSTGISIVNNNPVQENDKVENIYEYIENTQGILITETDVKTVNWYTLNLPNWDTANIWDISDGVMPKIKGLE